MGAPIKVAGDARRQGTTMTSQTREVVKAEAIRSLRGYLASGLDGLRQKLVGETEVVEDVADDGGIELRPHPLEQLRVIRPFVFRHGHLLPMIAWS